MNSSLLAGWNFREPIIGMINSLNKPGMALFPDFFERLALLAIRSNPISSELFYIHMTNQL